MFGKSYAPPVAEELPAKIPYIITVVYADNSTAKHLVVAENEIDAMVRLNKHWSPEKPVRGFKTDTCEEFSTVILGNRRLV